VCLWGPVTDAPQFVVSERDIEANLEKIMAITGMGPIQNIKVVQRVTGCLEALSSPSWASEACLSISC
jgi:hypothetical protein